jgi:integrase
MPNSKQKIPLTDAFCKSAALPASGNKLFRCGDTKGLALRVTAKGHRAFIFCYSGPDFREHRLTIGQYGPWSLAAARKRVGELRRAVDLGNDPLKEKQEFRDAVTVREYWTSYANGPLTKLSPSYQRDIRSAWKSKIEPVLGAHKKLAEITRHDVQCVIDNVTRDVGKVSANRCHSYLRRVLNLAKADGAVSENVATHAIQRNQEHSRERYLTIDELQTLFGILTDSPTPAAAAIKLLALTGARRSEVLSMRWEDINLDTGDWNKPPSATKQKRRHRVPLSAEAIAILRQRKIETPGSDYVFPSSGKSQHITEIKRPWAIFRQKAGIDDCRLHDLRHSYASLIASQGGSLQIISRLLGHTQIQTTYRYAHLFDGELRNAAESVALVTNPKK